MDLFENLLPVNGSLDPKNIFCLWNYFYMYLFIWYSNFLLTYNHLLFQKMQKVWLQILISKFWKYTTYLQRGRNVPQVYTKICWQMLPQEWWFDREHFEVYVPLTMNTRLIIVRNEGRTSLLETIHDWWSNNRPTYKKEHKNYVSLRTILKW